MPQQSTQERKIAALKTLNETIGGCDRRVWTSALVAEEIRKMSSAVRSELWRASVEQYAKFVEAEGEEDERHTPWAYFQGNVYFCSAVL